MTASHDHHVHPAVYKAKARASLAHAAGDKFRDLRDKLQEDANEMYDYGDEQGDRLITAHSRTADDAASIAFETAEALEVCADELRTLEAEVARLHRQNARLTEEVHDLRARLQEAHRDAEVLAAGENDRSMDIEGFTPYPALESVQGTQDDLFAAMQRASRRAEGAR